MMMWRLLLVSFCCLSWVYWGSVAHAQIDPPMLTVSLHDLANAPIVGATVIVRDASGTSELARAATDTHGIATFAALTQDQVRVAVTGALPDGTRLYQVGADATGILLLLASRSTTLDLRSERDGLVLPDPATMISRDLGVPIATRAIDIPAAPMATPIRVSQVQPKTPPSRGADQAGVGTDAVSEDRDGSDAALPVWFGLFVLAILVGAGIGIVLLFARWRLQ
jgi:hypothetical protein